MIPRPYRLALAFAALAAGTANAQQVHGTLLRPATIRISADASSAALADAQRGREAVVIKSAPDWMEVLVNLGQGKEITGWVEARSVVLPSTPNGDRILFGEAELCEDEASRAHGRRGAAGDAIRLYYRTYEEFPQSALAAEAIYRSADVRWQLDYADVMSLPSAREQDPIARSQIPEEYMRELIKRFPHTRQADLAAYHLLDNQVCGDWQGQSKCPERETELFEKYVREHPQSPKAPEALYKAAWRQAALIEIYKTEAEIGRSGQARPRALALANRVVTEYTQSDWAHRAAALIYKLEHDIPAYGNTE